MYEVLCFGLWVLLNQEGSKHSWKLEKLARQIWDMAAGASDLAWYELIVPLAIFEVNTVVGVCCVSGKIR
jgi:hypothetical protein